LKYKEIKGLVPALFQTIKELEQANPMILLKKSRFVPLFQQKRGGSGKTAQESGERSKGARRVKKPLKILETARFLKFPFFSLFSLILLSINSNKNKHLRRPPRLFDVPEYKNHGTKAGTRITQTLDFIRLFLFQTFRLSGTSGTRLSPALEQAPTPQNLTRLRLTSPHQIAA
jgi:hypothetical protein